MSLFTSDSKSFILDDVESLRNSNSLYRADSRMSSFSGIYSKTARSDKSTTPTLKSLFTKQSLQSPFPNQRKYFGPLPKGWVEFDDKWVRVWVHQPTNVRTVFDPRLVVHVQEPGGNFKRDLWGHVRARGHLPEGWAIALNSLKTVNFIHYRQGLTTAWDPREVQTLISLSGGQKATVGSNQAVRSGPLPRGWEMRLTDDGTLYFVDHVSKRGTYNDPRVKGIAVTEMDRILDFSKISRLPLIGKSAVIEDEYSMIPEKGDEED